MWIEMMDRIFRTVSKVFPKSVHENIRRMLVYAGMDVEAEVWLGQSLLLGILVFAVVASLSKYGNPLLFYPLAVLMFIVYLIGSYSIPYFQSANRSESVEELLPGVLQLMAADVRAGMTPFQAIKMSARKDFGVLKHELDKVTAKSLGAGSFSDALLGVCDKINSRVLERSIKLFIRSVESGAQIAKTLDETARDISENLNLKKELLTSTRTYTLLIMFSVLLGAPMLLTISIHFTKTLNELRSSVSLADIEGMQFGMLVGEGFSPDLLTGISIFIIAGTTFIASLLMGVIAGGEEKYGLKYAFFLVPLALAIFFVMQLVGDIILP